jgi:hypothetical protein
LNFLASYEKKTLTAYPRTTRKGNIKDLGNINIETFLGISVGLTEIAEYRSHPVDKVSANAMLKTTSASRHIEIKTESKLLASKGTISFMGNLRYCLMFQSYIASRHGALRMFMKNDDLLPTKLL